LCTRVQSPFRVFKPQISYTSDSLYPTFVVYFMDYTQPNDLESFSFKERGLIFFKFFWPFRSIIFQRTCVIWIPSIFHHL
jgi:hypothetical protein